MGLTSENGTDMIMPVAPMNGGFGMPYPVYSNGGNSNSNGWDNGWWIILLFILLASGNWGGQNNGGFINGSNNGTGNLYPWMNQAEITTQGFQNQLMNDNITSIRDGVQGLSTQLCNCCCDMQQTVSNGFAQAEIADNARQIANMQQAFATQTAITGGINNLSSQFADCCCENRLATERLNYTIATENCADRYEAAQNTRDIIENANRNNQSILDKLCQLELDAKNDKISDLERQLTMANLNASQVAQTAAIRAGQVEEVDALYNRLSNCPVPTMPVYGSQPIFSCNNNGCGCGCNGGF